MLSVNKTGMAALLISGMFMVPGVACADTVSPTATVTFSGTFVAPTCTMDSKTVAVDLGMVPVGDFTGPGTVVATTPFTLGFSNCDEGAVVVVSATGTPADGKADDFQNDGSAGHNVAVEIKSGETVMDAGGLNTVEQTAEDGVVKFPFTANMVQPGGSAPVPGAVTSVVTLNVAYR
ncbi:fimbrial protein [Cedecea sp.]|uniref:fimbrial protein n=1 Tax=Cedecea sp. TaxID=1970739 RepID=UPI002F3F4B24